MIEIEDVSYTYPGGPTAVKEVTLKVEKGGKHRNNRP